MKQTESIPNVIDPEEAKKREDLRDVTMMFRQMQLMKTEQMRLNSLRQTKSKI